MYHLCWVKIRLVQARELISSVGFYVVENHAEVDTRAFRDLRELSRTVLSNLAAISHMGQFKLIK